jgi:tetratricopeptide (TPR) repeat protein
MAEALVLAIQTLELKASCSHCGNEAAELKRCSVCKHASYCGAACQNAAWKKHKKICVTLEEVEKRVDAALEGDDWRGVLKWEGRLEQLLEECSDAARNSRLDVFRWAHSAATVSTDHALAVVRLQDRRIEILGNMERFRDQGETMCDAAEYLVRAGKAEEAAAYYQRARDVGAAHGFFSVECKACLGLGKSEFQKNRHEEGVDLLRNALAASSLREDEDDTYMELQVLAPLTDALFRTQEIDEVEPLVPRFREAAMAESQKFGRVCFMALQSLYASARLLEVGNPSTPTSLPSAIADSVFQRFQHARVRKHAFIESSAPPRHAGSLRRPRGRCALCSTLCARTGLECNGTRYPVNICSSKPASTSRFWIRSLGRRISSSS